MAPLSQKLEPPANPVRFNTELEAWFSQLESVAAPIVEKILAAARVWRTPGLTAAERADWDFFFYQQFRRVPDLYESLLTPEQHRVQVEKHLDAFSKHVRPVTNRERSDMLNPANLKRMYRNLRVSSLKTGSDNVLDVISARGLAVCRIPNPKKSFVLGSRPVIKLTTPETSDLSDGRVELWLAVAPDVMVGIGPPGKHEVIVDISDKNVRCLNEGIAAQSSQIIGRSKQLITSLAPYVGLKVGKSPLPEEWDNLWVDDFKQDAQPS